MRARPDSWRVTHCAVSVFLLQQLAVLEALKELKSALASLSKLQYSASASLRPSKQKMRGFVISGPTVSQGVLNRQLGLRIFEQNNNFTTPEAICTLGFGSRCRLVPHCLTRAVAVTGNVSRRIEKAFSFLNRSC